MTPMALETTQKRLESHFESLSRGRSVGDYAIFALEHGLSDTELSELSSMLLPLLTSGRRLSSYWLLWVIYATERGYAYAGDEYWQSFEDKTPGWELSDRNKLVTWFRRFQETYGGIVPSGPWANNFRIIAWPITHAVVPKYLQQQLARTLFDLRFRLASLKADDPTAIGRLLAAHADHASSRFREFLQQQELIGRVVLALLHSPKAEGDTPIYRPTLERIVNDLERVRSSRTWLREAQRVVSDRFIGIGRGRGPTPTSMTNVRAGQVGSYTPRIDIRPNVCLTHRGADTWSVLLNIPSFREVAKLGPDVANFLRRTRCRLNGADDVKPAAWLLSGNRKGVLHSWPDVTKPLIQFDRSHGVIDNLLKSECRLSSGPIWLFRVARDGTAREITGRVVRPGCSYVVLKAGELPAPHVGIAERCVDCAGITSFRLSVPSDVSTEDTARINRLGLQVARTIRVWPAGLPGRNWDGEGRSEWLTTEAPCLGIMHDHPVDAYLLGIDGGPQTVMESGDAGQPIFVRISPLTTGTHLLTVRARRSTSLDALPPTPSAQGFAQLVVRDPEPWTPGVISHHGLIARLDPHEADLDRFWSNEVDLSVLGPESHSVTLTVSLEGKRGQQLLVEQVGSMRLPVVPDAWRSRFHQFLNRNDESVLAYLDATRGHLLIRADELGEYRFLFEHDVLPVRWVLRRDRQGVTVRIVDDTGRDDSAPQVQFFSMDTPAIEKQICTERAFSGISVHRPPGGLYVVTYTVPPSNRRAILIRHGSDAVIVSTMTTGGDFKSVGVTPSFPELRNGSVTAADALHRLALWSDARRFGFVVNARHEQVVNGFIRAILFRLCGERWARAEEAFASNRGSPKAVEDLQQVVGQSVTTLTFAATLRRGYMKLEGDMNDASTWYTALAKQYRICTDRILCDFALRLASQPQRVSRIYGSRLDGLLHQIRQNSIILRGARMLALLSANHDHDRPFQVLPRWKW